LGQRIFVRRTEASNYTTYHAFQAISDVDRTLVARIGPTTIAATSLLRLRF
jgi:hypothetical protein